MAAPQDVHVRICNQEIVKFDLEVKALIQDIRDCSGPLSALTELNTKVKEKFQQLRHRIQPVLYQRAFIWTASTFFFKLTYSLTDFSSTQHDFNSPTTPVTFSDLEQLAKEQDKESEKQLLLQEVENHKKQMLRKTTKESLAQTSSTITESLMGISRMMAQQVQQSEEAMQSLVTSSRTILDANEEFKSMSGTIQLGRKLITKYNRRELTDKLLIFLALALFLATVLYIVKKRLFPFL
ncbi:BCL2 interacting protein 1 [Homo sapiens]|uniref:Isoform 4 of Vesicle transport protein SEC20 n=1 Tax=Homo sapiens TaxID=9606 RepID=Q12981-3|nr:vesicle transport protein SEC20 isoform BNIP1-c [Homo sapiens]EAW61406.1 BCL2/adenovirus E1B 19kDa interacting protein 1, isoform CRA_b [Homo sapiens]EAW61412.1 BCL2/adenovirus E1B 19kDa interacting protein 1, isoform CRA_b [Homo sapiens]KAI2540163.1 BCL2 interacting protein 1 [Homo sapiens]KAI4023929.1 BCL2 interacting protein 1 [Homo sapiens]|eukprot:NP_053583.2 vesicle transport protein SEC20 isoform BNIP1-c [Homo sapiens]